MDTETHAETQTHIQANSHTSKRADKHTSRINPTQRKINPYPPPTPPVRGQNPALRPHSKKTNKTRQLNIVPSSERVGGIWVFFVFLVFGVFWFFVVFCLFGVLDFFVFFGWAWLPRRAWLAWLAAVVGRLRLAVCLPTEGRASQTPLKKKQNQTKQDPQTRKNQKTQKNQKKTKNQKKNKKTQKNPNSPDPFPTAKYRYVPPPGHRFCSLQSKFCSYQSSMDQR